MEKTTTNRLFLVLIGVLFIAPVFAGCFGDGEDVDATKDGVAKKSGSDVSVVDDAADGDGLRNGTNGDLKDLPKAHFHHYWNNREEVTIFDGDVEFDNANLKWFEYNSLTGAEFDLETDGDQVSSAEDNRDLDNPHANDPAPDGHADTVFAGTSHIDVKFPARFFEGVGQLVFWFKAANTPEYGPEGGMLVQPGDTVTIKLNEVGMADPAHQTAVSRWKFRLVGLASSNPLCENELYCAPAVGVDPQNADGDPTLAGLKMIAFKGSEELLDPPHPDFWGGKDKLAYEPVTGAVNEPTAQTPVLRERHSQLTNIALPPGNLVPMGTERVEVKVDWQNDLQSPDGFFMKLRYHAANGTAYMEPDDYSASECASGSCTYTIYNVHPSDGDRGLVDPPYEANSYWRFQLVPTVVNGDTEQVNTGAFQGSYTITATAFKEEGFVLV